MIDTKRSSKRSSIQIVRSCNVLATARMHMNQSCTGRLGAWKVLVLFANRREVGVKWRVSWRGSGGSWAGERGREREMLVAPCRCSKKNMALNLCLNIHR